jgi:NADH-quinone oxidoreductase subunit N
VSYVWLAVLAVLLSPVDGVLLLRIVKLMSFDEPETDAVIMPQGTVKILISANGIVILAFGIFSRTLIALCAYAIQHPI